MSILNALVAEGPLKGFPFSAALAIEAGRVTPAEAKQKLIESYRAAAAEAAAKYEAAIAATQALPDTISIGAH